MKVFVIDLSICNGCYNCQIACKDEHVGNDWTPYAKPQPDTGQFWMRIDETERGSIPKVKVSYVPVPCMHCDEAPCISACTSKVISKRDDGLVIIGQCPPARKTWMMTGTFGCSECVDACPYQVIYYNDALTIAQKCTGCAHLIDKGEEPRCVEACPTEALKFGEEEDFKELIGKAEILNPEFNTKPRVYYIGLPKRFVSGAVYDPEEDECIESGTVTLKDSETSDQLTTKTDEFGDFWFEGLKIDHTYSLTIEKDGCQPVQIKDINTKKDVNLGDIALHKVKPKS